MSPPVSPRKPKGSGFERREEILAASLRLFGERGVHGVSTRQIAEAVGISQPTLYAYFPSKDHIAAELSARAFAELERRLSGPHFEFSEDGLAAAFRTYIDFGLENPDAYRVAFMIEGAHAAAVAADEAHKPGRGAFDVLRGAIRQMHEMGMTTTDDPERLAQSLWAGMHGLVSLLIARPQFPWGEREGLIEAHVRMLARAALRP
ncbi:MAG: TetR/AcrR family transcriptional regulator [Phenylobacterium sp.]|jgi:AcrR family transcriptional regulator|uniref:TetR/AcrR family transcriptional regulator n=1 Tax=Phenylobacterium sp. TaxID=1871053 RepID=UPI002A360AE1|nr:TetR/AcrR family transcriptional regulator [Phenylobacterium sp.]MDX9997942.1 TetR/AcrR family transcriptional regulator [Phenylobacterium sp.]